MLEARPDAYGWGKERLLRVLLDPVFGIPGGKTLYQVAKDARVSYPWAHDIWRDLLQTGAFISPRGRRHESDSRYATLGNPLAAFQYWLQHRPARIYADYHVVGALDFLKASAARTDLEYVATTYLAENMIQGHLFPRRFDLYVRSSEAATWAKELNKRGFPVDSSAEGRGVIRLITAEDALVDGVAPMQPAPLKPDNPIRGIWVVRTPLLIVDLLEEGGACVEAAQMLMEKTYGSPLQRT